MPTLEGLISNGKTKEAIDQLHELITELYEDKRSRLELLSGRFSKIKKDDTDGRVSTENKSIEFNNIDYSFLGLLKEVKESIQSNIGFFKPMTKDTDKNELIKDFLITVLAKKYTDIKFFHSGSLFIYYSAKEKSSKVDVMVMVAKESNIHKTITETVLQQISQLNWRE